MIYTKDFTVTSSKMDATSYLSVVGVFETVEECVTELYGELGIDGFTVAEKFNACWVFLKTRIEMIKPIEWKASYSASAFFSKKSAASMQIDVAIRNSDGDLCSYAKVEAVSLDLDTGKIRKVDTVGVGEDFEIHEPLSKLQFTRFPKNELPEIDTVKIKYTNIDYLQHTNNKEYPKFILNTYEVKDLIEKPIKELEIQYAGQAVEHDVLSICKDVIDGKEIFAIKRDGVVLIKCEIVR